MCLLSFSFQVIENLARFLFVQPAQRKTDVNDHVIADLGFRHVSQAGLLEDAAKIDLAHARHGVVAADAFNFSWNRQTHVV